MCIAQRDCTQGLTIQACMGKGMYDMSHIATLGPAQCTYKLLQSRPNTVGEVSVLEPAREEQ